jgi:hypothetical protein
VKLSNLPPGVTDSMIEDQAEPHRALHCLRCGEDEGKCKVETLHWCPRCGETSCLIDEPICEVCAGEVDEENSVERERELYDRHINQKIDEAKDRRLFGDD